jgi:hypothetical protein
MTAKKEKIFAEQVFPEQAHPEQALLKRRRQIFNGETGPVRPCRADALEKTSRLADTGAHEDLWIRGFLSRLAGRVRDIGRRGK